MLTVNASSTNNLIWGKTYGGPQDDGANSIVNTTDGGYIIAGYTSSYGNVTSNVWLIKTDADGKEQWNKTYGGNKDDAGYSVVQTNDGGYAVTGYETSFTNGTMSTFLMKTDANGNLLWNRTFSAGVQDAGFSLAKTSDEGFIITGFTYQTDKAAWNVSLIKTDKNGILEWNRSFGGVKKDCGHSVIQTSDGGYAITGYTKSYGIQGGDSYGFGAENLWLIKVDQNGNEQWNTTFGGKNYDDGFSIVQDPDGGFTIAGTTQSFFKNGTPAQTYIANNNARVYIIKTDTKGNLLWNQTFGGDMDTAGFSMAKAPDGGYLISGTIFTNNSSADAYALKVDSNGTGLWASEYGGSADDYGLSISPSSDNQYVIAGYTRSYGNGGSDLFLLKIADNETSNSSSSGLSSICGSLAIMPIVLGFSALLGTKIRKKK